MNADIKEKWVAALRSGKYQQTREGYLQKDGRFCCLGVLCDLLDPAKWATEHGDTRWDGNISMLPGHVSERTAIAAHIPSELITMNDTDQSFAEIADWIETNL